MCKTQFLTRVSLVIAELKPLDFAKVRLLVDYRKLNSIDFIVAKTEPAQNVVSY